MRAGQLRHTVNVMRPAPPRGDRDQEDDPQVLREKVQCSIETISGREAQRLQQMYPTATHRVKMWGDPAKPLSAADWLIELPSNRRLNIIPPINDKQRNGLDLELVCIEAVT